MASEPERVALACSTASEMAEKGTMLVNASAAGMDVLHDVGPPRSHAHEFNCSADRPAPGRGIEQERPWPVSAGIAPDHNGVQPLDEPARLAVISKDHIQHHNVAKSLQPQRAERPPQGLEQPDLQAAGSPSSPRQLQQQQQQQQEQSNRVHTDQLSTRHLTAQCPEQISCDLVQHPQQEQMRQRLHHEVCRHTCQRQLQHQEHQQLGRDSRAQQYDSCTAERQQLSGPSQGNGPHRVHGLHPLQRPTADAAAACQAALQPAEAKGTTAVDSRAASAPALTSTPCRQLHGSASGKLRLIQQQPAGPCGAGSRDDAQEPGAQHPGIAGAGLQGRPSEGVACPPDAGLANGPASCRQPSGDLGPGVGAAARASGGATTPGNSVGSAAHGEPWDGGARRSSSGLSAGGPGSAGLPGHPCSRALSGGYPQGSRASSTQPPEPAGGSRPLLMPKPEPNADTDPGCTRALGPVLSGPIRGAVVTASDQAHPAAQAGDIRKKGHDPVGTSPLGFAGARRWPSGRQPAGAVVEEMEGARGSQAAGAGGRTHEAGGHEQGVGRSGNRAEGRGELEQLGCEGAVKPDTAAVTGGAANGGGVGRSAGRFGDGFWRPHGAQWQQQLQPALAVRFRPDACPELPKDRIRALAEALAAHEQEEVQTLARWHEGARGQDRERCDRLRQALQEAELGLPGSSSGSCPPAGAAPGGNGGGSGPRASLDRLVLVDDLLEQLLPLPEPPLPSPEELQKQMQLARAQAARRRHFRLLLLQVFAGTADLINALEHCQAVLQGREAFIPATGLLAAATPSTTSTSQPPSPVHASANPPPNTANAAAIAAALAAADAAGDFALPASAPTLPLPEHSVPSPAALRRASSSNGPNAPPPLHDPLSTSQPALGPGPDRSRRVGVIGAACREANHRGRPAVPAPGPGPDVSPARGSDEHSGSPPLWPRVSGQEGSPRLRASPPPPLPVLRPQPCATGPSRVAAPMGGVRLPLAGAVQVHAPEQGVGPLDMVGQAVCVQGTSSIALGRAQQQLQQQQQQQQQEWQQQGRWQREPQERQQQQLLQEERQEQQGRQSVSTVSASGRAGETARGSGDGCVLLLQQGPRTSLVQGERQELGGMSHPGVAPQLLVLQQPHQQHHRQQQQRQQEQLGMELGGPGRRGTTGLLGGGAGAEGAAGGRGAPQLPLADRWREHQPAGHQVHEGKLLKLLQALLRHPGGLSLEQLLEAGGGPQEDTDTARALQRLVDERALVCMQRVRRDGGGAIGGPLYALNPDLLPRAGKEPPPPAPLTRFQQQQQQQQQQHDDPYNRRPSSPLAAAGRPYDRRSAAMEGGPTGAGAGAAGPHSGVMLLGARGSGPGVVAHGSLARNVDDPAQQHAARAGLGTQEEARGHRPQQKLQLVVHGGGTAADAQRGVEDAAGRRQLIILGPGQAGNWQPTQPMGRGLSLGSADEERIARAGSADRFAAAGAGGVIREVYVDRDGRYVLALPLRQQQQQDQEQQLAPHGGRYAGASVACVPVWQGFGGEEGAGGALVLPESAAERLVVVAGGGGGGVANACTAQGRMDGVDVRHAGPGRYILAKRVAAAELHDGGMEPPTVRQRL